MNQNFDHPETGSSKIKMIIIIVAAVLLYGLFAGIRANTSLLATEIANFTGIPYGEVSTAFSILNLVLAICVPIVGILSLKIQKFYLMLAGAVFCAIGFVGTAWAMSTLQLVLFIGIFFGFGVSLLSFTIVFSAARPFVGEKVSSILAGILLASQGVLGMITSHAINGFIEAFGLTLCLVIIAVSALCLIPLTFLFLKKKVNGDVIEKKEIIETEEEKKKHSIKYVLKNLVTNPFFYIIALGAIAFGLGDGGLMNHSSRYLEEVFGTGDYSAAVVSIYTVSILAGSLIGGIMGAKVKNKMLTTGILFLVWAVFNWIIQAFIDNSSFGMNIPAVTVALTFITGFLINLTCPIIIACTVERVSIAVSAAVLPIIESSIFVIYAIDSFFGGIFHDIFGNFDLMDTIATWFAILVGIIYILYAKKNKNKMHEVLF